MDQEQDAVVTPLQYTDITKFLPPRSPDAHKGLFGHVLVVGGDYGMPGAVRIAAETALRCGSGLVSVATRTLHISVVCGGRPEVMCHGIDKIGELDHLIAHATVVVLGPGLGSSAWSKELFEYVLKCPLPMIVDGDALTLLSEKPMTKRRWILTPHPGEAARLLHCSTKEVQEDRERSVRLLQTQYDGVAVLKGAGTLICEGSGRISQCTAGNPGMASAGMGDCLTGVIASLLAQGLSLADAAKVGVYLHATAGDKAASKQGERGLLALDLIPYLMQLVNAYS